MRGQMVLGSIVTLGLSVIIITSCQSKNPITSTSPILEEPTTPSSLFSASAKTNPIEEVVIEANLSLAEIHSLPGDFVERAAIAGWQKTPAGFRKTILLSEALAQDVNRKIIRLEGIGKRGLQVGSLQLSFREGGQREGRPVYQLLIPFKDRGHCPLHKIQAQATQAASNAMEDGRCLDYNGWWTDGGNYPKDDWRAYRNFVMSDCDRALVFCVFDHVVGGCVANHGHSCSRFIGHDSFYHKHDFPW